MFHASSFLSESDDEEAILSLQQLDLSLRRRPPTPPAQPGPNFLRDLTSMAVWSVSTAKPGNGVEQLLDGRNDTYWQSDGPQPHTISAQFTSKVRVSAVELYLDYAADESYTPASVSVYAGCNEHDLRLVRRLRKLPEPQGWVSVPMGVLPTLLDDTVASEEESETGEETPDEVAIREGRRMQRGVRREKRRKERLAEVEERVRRREKGVNGRLEGLRDLEVTKTQMVRLVIHCNHQNGRDSHVRKVRALGPREQVGGSGSRFSSKEFQMYETIR